MKQLFQKGHAPSKPKGAVSQATKFKTFLFNNFEKNKVEAGKRLDEMYRDKTTFMPLLNLLTNHCPKQIEQPEGIRTGETRIIFVTSKDRIGSENRVKELSV